MNIHEILATNLQTGWATGSSRSFTVNNSSYYKYFRIEVLRVSADGNNIHIGEWRLFGRPLASMQLTAMRNYGVGNG